MTPEDFGYSPDAGGHPTVRRILAYPSTAIGTAPNRDVYLYAAYTDGNLDNETHQPDGTLGIYAFEYDLSNPPQGLVMPSQVGRTSGITYAWQPSLALSPDGSHAFIGFYGGNAVYDPVANTSDQQYNLYYIVQNINKNGFNWSGISGTQLTNLNGSGQPNGGYFHQPTGPFPDAPGNGFAPEWLPDYDSASADYQDFHYSFMETSNEQVTDGSGNQVTLQGQTDVYMANVPIPYVGAVPATPSGLTLTQASDGSGSLTLGWNGGAYLSAFANAYVEYSVAGQGWLSFGQPVAASYGSVTWTIPNYSASTTYYFRVRVQNVPEPGDNGNGNADASSAWSTVLQSWTGGNYTPDLWYYAAGTVTGDKYNHTLYNFDFAYPSDGSGQPVYADLQWWDYFNQRWDQIDHILLDSAGGLAYYFDPSAASGQDGVQITSNDQFQIRFSNSSGGGTAWLGLYPNEQTSTNAPADPGYITAAMSDDGQTLEVTWATTGYGNDITMVISVTGNGSEWWDPSTQTQIWLVQNTPAQGGSESISVSNLDGLTLKFQAADGATGQVSDVVYYYLS